MLIDSFYTLVNNPLISETINIEKPVIFSVTVKINPTHPIFKGHFPDKPIVPGVTYIEMIREIMEIVIQGKLFLVESSNIKFLSITNPLVNDELTFNFSIMLKSHNRFFSKVLVSSENSIVIKFDGIFSNNFSVQ
jgi:3-hydroxyacyl-[acyl-carrier-protein] dehydratase